MRHTFELGRWMFDFDNEWVQLFCKCNWYTFRFFQLEFEWDKYCGSVEFMTTILGFGLRIAYALPNKLSESNRERWSLEVDKALKSASKKKKK